MGSSSWHRWGALGDSPTYQDQIRTIVYNKIQSRRAKKNILFHFFKIFEGIFFSFRNQTHKTVSCGCVSELQVLFFFNPPLFSCAREPVALQQILGLGADARIKWWKSCSCCHHKHGLGSSIFPVLLSDCVCVCFSLSFGKSPGLCHGCQSEGELHVCVCVLVAMKVCERLGSQAYPDWRGHLCV